MPDPSRALTDLAAQLRAEESVISGHVTDPVAEPTLGLLVAAGPRAAEAPGEYALVDRGGARGLPPPLRRAAPRDGSRRRPRACSPATTSTRSASTGSPRSATPRRSRELADLISLAAQLHARGASPAARRRSCGWRPRRGRRRLERRPRGRPRRRFANGNPRPRHAWRKSASDTASSEAGLGERLEAVAEAIDFRAGGTCLSVDDAEKNKGRRKRAGAAAVCPSDLPR